MKKSLKKFIKNWLKNFQPFLENFRKFFSKGLSVVIEAFPMKIVLSAKKIENDVRPSTME